MTQQNHSGKTFSSSLFSTRVLCVCDAVCAHSSGATVSERGRLRTEKPASSATESRGRFCFAAERKERSACSTGGGARGAGKQINYFSTTSATAGSKESRGEKSSTSFPVNPPQIHLPAQTKAECVRTFKRINLMKARVRRSLSACRQHHQIDAASFL